MFQCLINLSHPLVHVFPLCQLYDKFIVRNVTVGLEDLLHNAVQILVLIILPFLCPQHLGVVPVNGLLGGRANWYSLV